MNSIESARSAAPTPATSESPVHSAANTHSTRLDDDALRRACAELEGIFLEQLMKALRDTVPQAGLLDGGVGEEIFSSMLDQHLSSSVTTRLERGIGAALYRQLRGPGNEVAELANDTAGEGGPP